MWNDIWPYLTAILPTIVVAYVFYLIMKAILESDRRERAAVKQWEADQHIGESPLPNPGGSFADAASRADDIGAAQGEGVKAQGEGVKAQGEAVTAPGEPASPKPSGDADTTPTGSAS